MEKYHKYISIGFALVFLIMLQQFPIYRPLFRILALVFLVFLAFFSAYNYWYLRKIQKYNFWVWLSPSFFYLSGFMLFLVIPDDFIKGLFLLATVALAAIFEAFLGNYSENVFLAEHLIMAFGFFTALTAYNFYYPNFLTLQLLGVFLAAFFMTRSLYEFIPRSGKTKLVAALAIGLFCSELFWAESFLPFHFSVLAYWLFNLFYLFLVLNYYYFFHTLNAKKFAFHLTLIFICGAAAFAATPWKIFP